MRIGSLFSGIGGLELGLERAGVGHVVWQVEKDPYCLGVLARHWPDATRYTDVHDVGGATLAPVDVVCGGFPCQDVSIAGTRQGLTGSRSGLWFEFERIVHEVRPRYVVVENVPGLVRRGLDQVVGGLVSRGYTVEGTRLRAEDVGAPHRRERIFLLAHACGHRVRDEQGRALQGPRASVPSNDGQARGVANPNGKGELQPQGPKSAKRGWPRNGRQPFGGGAWAIEPRVGRVAHGVPDRVDRLRTLGNAVVPQCAAIVGARILELEAA